jgi:hypothetical protein
VEEDIDHKEPEEISLGDLSSDYTAINITYLLEHTLKSVQTPVPPKKEKKSLDITVCGLQISK